MSSPPRLKTGTDRSKVSYSNDTTRVFESLKQGHNVLVICSTRGPDSHPEMILPKNDGELVAGYKNLMNKNTPVSNVDILQVYPFAVPKSKKKNSRKMELYRAEDNYVFWHSKDEVNAIAKELITDYTEMMSKLPEGTESNEDDPRMFVPLTEEEERALPEDLKGRFPVQHKDHFLGLMQEAMLNKFLDQPLGPSDRPQKGKAAHYGWPFVKLAKFTSMEARNGKTEEHQGFQFLFTTSKSFCKAVDFNPMEFKQFLMSNFRTIIFGSDEQFRIYKPHNNKGWATDTNYWDTLMAFIKSTGLKTYPPISLLEKLERRDKVRHALCPLEDDFVDHSIRFSKCAVDYKVESTDESDKKRIKSSSWRNVWEDYADEMYNFFGKPFHEAIYTDEGDVLIEEKKLEWPAKWLDPESMALWGVIIEPNRKHPKVGVINLERLTLMDASQETPQLTHEYVAHSYKNGTTGKSYDDPKAVPAFGYGKVSLGYTMVPFIPEIYESKVVIVGEQDQRGRIILIMGFQRQVGAKKKYDPNLPWTALDAKELNKFQKVCTKALGSLSNQEPDFDWGIYNNTLFRFDCFRGVQKNKREKEELAVNDGSDYFCTDVLPFNTNSDISHLGYTYGKNADKCMPNSVDDYSPVDLIASAFTKFFVYNYERWP